MTDEELAQPTPCPPGVPQELRDLTMKQNAEYIAEWKAEVTKHIRAYDRVMASKKASAKRTKPKSRS